MGTLNTTCPKTCSSRTTQTCPLLWERHISKRAWSPILLSRPKAQESCYIFLHHMQTHSITLPYSSYLTLPCMATTPSPVQILILSHELCLICLLTGIPVSSCTSPSSTRCQAAFPTSRSDRVISTNPRWLPTAYRVECKVTSMAQRPSQPCPA